MGGCRVTGVLPCLRLRLGIRLTHTQGTNGPTGQFTWWGGTLTLRAKGKLLSLMLKVLLPVLKGQIRGAGCRDRRDS